MDVPRDFSGRETECRVRCNQSGGFCMVNLRRLWLMCCGVFFP